MQAAYVSKVDFEQTPPVLECTGIDIYDEDGLTVICEYKINSFPPQPRKPAWLMDGIKWMQIKMFHKIDD